MGLISELESMRVDVDEALDRVMGDGDLYKMMLEIFVDTVKGDPLDLESMGSGNLEKIERQVHTLKGITGNLSMTGLFEGYQQALGLLRKNRPDEAKAVLERLMPEQEKIIYCIERHRNEC